MYYPVTDIQARAYLREGGLGGLNPPPPSPPKFSDFLLKSEGKEIEKIKNEKGWVVRR